MLTAAVDKPRNINTLRMVRNCSLAALWQHDRCSTDKWQNLPARCDQASGHIVAWFHSTWPPNEQMCKHSAWGHTHAHTLIHWAHTDTGGVVWHQIDPLQSFLLCNKQSAVSLVYSSSVFHFLSWHAGFLNDIPLFQITCTITLMGFNCRRAWFVLWFFSISCLSRSHHHSVETPPQEIFCWNKALSYFHADISLQIR